MIFNPSGRSGSRTSRRCLATCRQALEKSTDPAVRAQAQGWRIFRRPSPGRTARVLYVFVLDPAVPGADYSLGRILRDAYPDQHPGDLEALHGARSPAAGRSLNLTPVEPMPPMPPPLGDRRLTHARPARSPTDRRLRRDARARRCRPRDESRRPSVRRSGDLESEVQPGVDAVDRRIERFAAQLEHAIVQPRADRSEQGDLHAAAGIDAEVRLLSCDGSSPRRSRYPPAPSVT